MSKKKKEHKTFDRVYDKRTNINKKAFIRTNEFKSNRRPTFLKKDGESRNGRSVP
jgi:hypothetical protein